MKFFKKDSPLDKEQRDENRRIKSSVIDRFGGMRRNMSRGASNIFRMIKTRGGWGNKQLWGFREKGRSKKSGDSR